jgi:hypothetical protein
MTRGRLLVRAVAIILVAVHVLGGGATRSAAGAQPPHGGMLLMLGDEYAFVELVLDATAGRLTAYVLDSDARTGVPLAQPELRLRVTVAGTEPRPLVLRGEANPLTGEVIGATSQFGATADWLRGVTGFDGLLERIDVKGARLESVAFNVPRGREAHQDMLVGLAAPHGDRLVVRHSLDGGAIPATPSGTVGDITVFGATNPGFGGIRSPDPHHGMLPLGDDVAVRLRVTTVDAGVKVLVRDTLLDTAGQTADLGRGPRLHVHPAWQLALPGKPTGRYAFSFVLEADRPGIAPSAEMRLVLRPAP